MSSPKFNIARLNEAVQWAIDDEYAARNPRSGAPRQHSQGTWGEGHPDITEVIIPAVMNGGSPLVKVTCDSGCCLSGHLSMAAGDKFVIPESEIDDGMEPDETVEVDTCVTPDGRVMKIADRGIELLGISGEHVFDASMFPLFGASNDLNDIIEIAGELAGEFGETLTIDTRGMNL